MYFYVLREFDDEVDLFHECKGLSGLEVDNSPLWTKIANDFVVTRGMGKMVPIYAMFIFL